MVKRARKRKSNQALIVFVKNLIPNTVKTRIGKETGWKIALAIYTSLVDHLAKRTFTFQNAGLYLFSSLYNERREIWPSDTYFQVQSRGDLGQKMDDAIRTVLEESEIEKCLLIGSDCPDIDRGIVDRAFQLLDDVDVVLGPATDGGYYLIGGKTPLTPLFENMTWSTHQVLDQTINRCRENNLSYSLLGQLSDIDTYDDWQKWMTSNSSSY